MKEREEQIINASVQYNINHERLNVIGGPAILSDEEFIQFNKNPNFIAGAKWADANMPTLYVVTRCEEHSDYVEEVFIDKNKAEEYCKQFNDDDDEYHRHITEINVTL